MHVKPEKDEQHIHILTSDALIGKTFQRCLKIPMSQLLCIVIVGCSMSTDIILYIDNTTYMMFDNRF